MKYDYLTLVKTANGWELDRAEGFLRKGMNKTEATAKLISRHTSYYADRYNANIGRGSVTKLLPGGARKDTDRFDMFFDYAIEWGGFRTRYREGICRANAKR